MKNSALQHAYGVVGQAAAVTPFLLLTIFLAREVSLAQAGAFTVLVGASAAAFAFTNWGLRTTVVLDRFEQHSTAVLVSARIIGVTVAGIVVLLAGEWIGAQSDAIIAVIVLRACDGVIDLRLGISQARSDNHIALRQFAAGQVLKLAIVTLTIVAWFAIPGWSIYFAAALAGAISLPIASHGLWESCRDPSRPGSDVSIRSLRNLLVSSAWFALAIGSCALVTSSPRISLPLLYDGDELGVVGIALSVGTLFGMVFHTSWLRHVPRFRGAAEFRRGLRKFSIENLLVAGIAGLVSLTILPGIVGLLFSIEGAAELDHVRRVLLSCVAFFAGMNFCNLYKVTSRPWMESAAYLTALAVAIAAMLVSPLGQDIERLMVIAGATMMIVGLYASRCKPRTTNQGVSS